ncbi:MAG: hypothetical protein BZY81_07720 [SAR202 cluster bacterium Io17-Chloro-G4]|nr:MAG: hypothetical protein BZY81_07720 [SAR202 cluster bacterium Io17-Chloro-G4]
MNLNEFIEASFEKEHEFLAEAVGDLTTEEQVWRAGPEANNINWILWHMTRVEDMWIQFFIKKETEIWERDGWHEKFGLPTRDNGFEHTPEQVAAFPTLDLKELLNYGESVRSATLEYLRSLSPSDFEEVPRERRPEMSVGQIFRQIVGEFYQHQGHISYLKGLARSGAI